MMLVGNQGRTTKHAYFQFLVVQFVTFSIEFF